MFRFSASLLTCVAGIALVTDVAAAQTPAKSGVVPRDTAREQRLLQQVKPINGFAVTLFAAPPVAMYPTCLTSTGDGVVFVCVDPNLSLSATKGRGRVVRLVDRDHDGAADTYSEFAEMDSPRGLAFDGRTLFVMHPPNLTAYRDTTGDGIADVSEDLVTGLGFDLDFRGADHTTNGITLGIDGWIYIAVGDYGFRKAVGKDGTTISHRGGSVVRVRTDGSGLEIYAVGTRNTYDLAVSPLLQVFTRDNTNDGDGWDTRLHYIPQGANMGYPVLYKNFASEHMRSLADYGSGSGTGGLWVQDTGFPPGFGNTLYTADWLTNQILRHPLTANGGSFDAKQDVFLTVPHPSDMAMDAQSNMYIASLSGGAYTYDGDSVGYVVRVSPRNRATPPMPAPGTLTDPQLWRALSAPGAEVRLHAQQEILRRGERRGVVAALESQARDAKQPVEIRVAAMFTLKQLIGVRANALLVKATADPAVKSLALRALADNRSQLSTVGHALFVQALADSSPTVQMAALNGLVRLQARDAAVSIVPLTASTDAAVAHTAVNALVALNAWQAPLAALDHAPPAVQRSALRALQQMHDTALVSALVASTAHASTAASAYDRTLALARLYNREAEWKGDWWGTRPSFIGPYFAPTPWDGSARILPVLHHALLSASSDGFVATVDDFIRNRVLPQGARSLLLAIGNDSAIRQRVVTVLTGNAYVTERMIPLLTQLSVGTGPGSGTALRTGVAELLATEPALINGALPLVRSAALDTTLPEVTRAKSLSLIGALTGRAGIDAAMGVYAQVVPVIDSNDTSAASSGPLETAWRRYVGDRRRLQELDQFISLTRSAHADERTLGFAVLLQAVRGNRVAPVVSDKVRPVLNEAWISREAGDDLVRATAVMRLGAQYSEQLAKRRSAPPQPPIAAGDWLPLFNGRDLKDWDIKFAGHTLNDNFRNTFRVEDGLLKVRYDQWTDFKGEFGHIFYKQPFSYYIVAVEYRFVGDQLPSAAPGNGWASRNNGIMVHSQSAASMGLKQDFPISLEVQLLGGLGTGTRTNGNLCTPGTNVVMDDKLITTHCVNSSSITYDGDQWVRVEALVLGDSVIKHIVNGDTVLTYFKPQMGGGNANNTNPGVQVNGKLLSSGFITLQAETAPIDFRKVEILNLAGCMDKKYKSYRSYFVMSEPAKCR